MTDEKNLEEKKNNVVDAEFETKAKKTSKKEDKDKKAAKKTKYSRYGKIVGYIAIPLLAIGSLFGAVKGCNYIGDYFSRVGGSASNNEGNDYNDAGSLEGKASVENRGKVVYEGVIDGNKLRHVIGINENSKHYDILFVERANGEKYALYDYDKTNNELERIVANYDGKTKVFGKNEVNDLTDYGRKVGIAFYEWEKFYGKARVTIAEKLNDERIVNDRRKAEDSGRITEGKEMEFKKIYDSLDKLAPKKSDN